MMLAAPRHDPTATTSVDVGIIAFLLTVLYLYSCLSTHPRADGSQSMCRASAHSCTQIGPYDVVSEHCAIKPNVLWHVAASFLALALGRGTYSTGHRHSVIG